MVTLDVSDTLSTIGKYGREYAWATGFAGFVWGATNDIGYGGTSTQALGQRLTDTIARVSGFQTSLGGLSEKSTQPMSFSPGNILNKGSYLAVGLELLHGAMPNKWTKLAKDVLQPPAAGYGIGKMFDAAYMPNMPGPQPNFATSASWQGL